MAWDVLTAAGEGDLRGSPSSPPGHIYNTLNDLLAEMDIKNEYLEACIETRSAGGTFVFNSFFGVTANQVLVNGGEDNGLRNKCNNELGTK